LGGGLGQEMKRVESDEKGMMLLVEKEPPR
jgi:hypothetical protein